MKNLKILITFIAGTIFGSQAPTLTRSPALPVFEAVSIKPNNSGSPAAAIGGGVRNGRFTSTNATLKLLIQVAYQVQAYDIAGGPPWLENERYDIVAKTEDGMNPTAEEGFAMIQAMLADRFKLKVHRDKREASVYVLLAGKSPKLPAGTNTIGGGIGRGHIALKNANLDTFVKRLGTALSRPIVNKTNIDGNFDITLDWTLDPLATPSAAAAEPGASVFTAIQEQLGLKLESQKTMVEVLVIDQAEKATPN